jgi:hypothetical protein
MRNLNRLTDAANTIQARTDYAWLLNLAAEHNVADLIPPAGSRPGHRAFDAAAKVGVENLLRERPELREQVVKVYPGFVKGETPCQ